MTVATERPPTLVPTPEGDVPRSRSTSTTGSGGWYDPDSAAWEPDASPVFEAFEAGTSSRPQEQLEGDALTRRSGY